MTMQNQYVAFPGASAIAADLTALAANDLPELPNGYAVYVVAEKEVYRLDTQNPLTTSSPLIVARGATSGAGKWYRRSRAYVVANFTLWVAAFNSINYALGYTPGQLTATGTVQADIVITSADNSNDSISAVVDALGNLWWNIEGTGIRAIHRIALKDTLQTGNPTPAALIDPGNASNQIAFDKKNNLWISIGAAAFQKYTPTQYANSGTPTPTIFCQPRNVTGGQSFMLFDDRDNLWSASFSGPTISMMGAEQLLFSSTVTQTPSVVWSGANVVGPSGLAFGPTGLLWTGSYATGAGTVQAYDPRSPSSGNQARVISLTSASFVGVQDVNFDSAGNLWVLNFDNGKLLRIPAAQLTASGAVTPDVIITIDTPTGSVAGTVFSFNFSQNPNRSGLLPSGAPIAATA